jgi:DNA-directed RNA polymerase subunit beta
MSADASVNRIRKNFSRIESVIDIPNLIDIQRRSFDRFLQVDVEPEKRESVGLQAVFNSIFPIRDFNETASLEFVSYTLEEPKYDVQECLQRGMTYAAPIKVTIRLIVWDNADATAHNIRDVKEQEVYFGEIPMMTDNGTFIINGTERVIVSQLHRSPGIFFDVVQSSAVTTAGKKLYSCRVIPYRGSWLDIEFDHKDLIQVRIDRRRKLHATVLLKALGYSAEELLNFFHSPEVIRIDGKKLLKKAASPEHLIHQKASKSIKVGSTNIVREGKKFTQASVRKLAEAGIDWLPITTEDLFGRTDGVKRVASEDIVDENTGEVLLDCNEEMTEEVFEELKKRGIFEFPLLYLDPVTTGTAIHDTLAADKTMTREEGIIDIYRRLRPGDPPTIETATTVFNNLFFNPDRYDLSRVGRLKMNHKLGVDVPIDETTLRREDILMAVKYLVDLKNGDTDKRIDDIDHLGNRRVRVVGELLENQYRVGLVRMERAIKERMSLQEIEQLMPHDLINSKPVSAVIKEFFGSSQLSQFMDQTNPLSAVTHKRRLSALGPGGLTRERAGFEVRDVHTTHYGRICPVETPEGPNIGLIASLSTYARVNDYGFIETPYREVDKTKVSERVRYLSALEEERVAIAQANAPLSKDRKFQRDYVAARKSGEFVQIPRQDIDMMDVSPNQLVSVAASLIPFLENDDANRALMGSNMQRQALPLMRTEAPLVGTGMEGVVARDSGVTVVAKRSGVVSGVDASRIVIKPDAERGDEYPTPDIINLVKYQRSNQNTCINQKPIVRVGQRVQKGEVIADGPATDSGELALGRNVIVAFMPWGGRRSRATFPTSGRRRSRTSTRAGSCESGPRSSPRTSSSGRSRPRGRPSFRRRNGCCGRSSAKRRGTSATPRSAFRRGSPESSSARGCSRGAGRTRTIVRGASRTPRSRSSASTRRTKSESSVSRRSTAFGSSSSARGRPCAWRTSDARSLGSIRATRSPRSHSSRSRAASGGMSASRTPPSQRAWRSSWRRRKSRQA